MGKTLITIGSHILISSFQKSLFEAPNWAFGFNPKKMTFFSRAPATKRFDGGSQGGLPPSSPEPLIFTHFVSLKRILVASELYIFQKIVNSNFRFSSHILMNMTLKFSRDGVPGRTRWDEHFSKYNIYTKVLPFDRE